MTNDECSNYALQRLLCAKATSLLNRLAQHGSAPDPRLMAAVEAKLAYLEGKMSSEELELFFLAAQEAKVEASKGLIDGRSSGSESIQARANYFAAEAASCAASNEPVPDIDDPQLDQMLEHFLVTGQPFG